MESDLFNMLFEERYAQEVLEIETKYREQLAAKEAELHDVINSMRNMVEETLVTRFPQTSEALLQQLRQLTSITHFNVLLHTITTAQNLSDVEHMVQQMRESSQN